MYEAIIKKYINNITMDNIYDYCNNNDIRITGKDANTIYRYIKTYNIDILKNPLYYLEDIKNKVNIDIYNKLIVIYNENKKKLTKFS